VPFTRPEDCHEPVVVYETRFCGFCTMAKNLLRRRGIDFAAVNVGRDAEARRWLAEQSGQRTIPQIFVHGRAIGGFQELVELDRSGALETLHGPRP
jgi:glutaredoxin 3